MQVDDFVAHAHSKPWKKDQIIKGGEQKCTLGDRFSNFPPKSIWCSRSIGVATLASLDLCLRNLSKIARRRNIEMRMAVATNPKDTALTESSNCFQWSDLKGATVGGVASTPIMTT